MYRQVREVLDNGLPPTANTGLLYDRYADIWSGATGNWKPQDPPRGDSPRTAFLKEIRRQARDAVRSLQPLLDAWHRRRAALWQAQGAAALDLTLEAPLVSGLGMTHALEVGFIWDRNLGVPFLPASSLKGVARAWAEQWEGREAATAARLFGDLPAAGNEGGGAGAIVFHALYPVSTPPLRLDVLNPHFGAYYQGRERPADSLAPNPIFFLTVPVGAVFRTALQPRANAVPGDLEEAERCLREALAVLGAGGKTAVGYGLFKPSA